MSKADKKSESGPKPYAMDEELQKRIFESEYWTTKGVEAYSLDDVIRGARELTFIGGADSKSGKVSPFLCLVTRLLQILPKRKKVARLLESRQPYGRAVLAMYSRLVFDARGCRKLLVDLQYDYQNVFKLRRDDRLKACQLFSFADELMSRKTSIGLPLPEIGVSKVQKEPYYDDNYDIDFYEDLEY